MVGPQPQQQEQRDPGREVLKEIKSRLPSRLTAEEAVTAVMCTFSQHVSGGEARHVFHLLPATLHPLLERCMVHRHEEAETFGRDQLVVRVADHLGVSLEEAESVASVVLKAISSRLPRREMKEIAHQLPLELRDLWVEEPAVEPHPMYLEIEASIQLPRAVNGKRAVLYVLCNMSRRLSKGEARQLADSLPHEVRPLIEPCVTARGEQPEHFTKRELLEHIGKDLHTQSPEPIVCAVLDVVQRHLRPEVIAHVKAQLPADLRELWTKGIAPPHVS
jgi:uncharacterized protein (DUF2267 family)